MPVAQLKVEAFNSLSRDHESAGPHQRRGGALSTPSLGITDFPGPGLYYGRIALGTFNSLSRDHFIKDDGAKGSSLRLKTFNSLSRDHQYEP